MDIFLLFLIYSFLGCVLENIYYYILHKSYVSKRMLLNLPLCPVYGFACLLLGALSRKGDSPLLLFATGFLAVSAVELLYYLISKRAYGIKWWDYSKRRIQLLGGVSLFYSALWGAANIIFTNYIHPICSLAVFAMPQSAKLFVGLFSAVYFWSDAKETHFELKKYKKGEKNLIDEKFLYLKTNN